MYCWMVKIHDVGMDFYYAWAICSKWQAWEGHKFNLFQIVCKKKVQLIEFCKKSFKCEHGALIHYENILKIYLLYSKIYLEYIQNMSLIHNKLKNNVFALSAF